MNFRLEDSNTGLASCFMTIAVLLAMVAKSFFPAGFMPVFDHRGFSEIVICSGAGQKVIQVPLNDTEDQNHLDDESSDVCIFQMLISDNLFSSNAAMAGFIAVFIDYNFAAQLQEIFSAFYFSLFYATGPPAF